jgi:hypothetical protein
MTPTEAARPRDDGPPRSIAPWTHTAILIGVFLATAVAGAFFQARGPSGHGTAAEHPNVVPMYLSLLLLEWGLVFYVWRGGLRRSGTRLLDLIGGSWRRPADLLRDGALAVGCWLLWMGIQKGWDLWLGPDQAKSVNAFLPRSLVEISLWVALSLSAGFCEELVFRGYFQRQFAVFTRNRGAALLLQAVLFGVAHGYQGIAAIIKITLFGVLYGALALWRRSLRPGMVAHAWSDIYSGWLGLL